LLNEGLMPFVEQELKAEYGFSATSGGEAAENHPCDLW